MAGDAEKGNKLADQQILHCLPAGTPCRLARLQSFAKAAPDKATL